MRAVTSGMLHIECSIAIKDILDFEIENWKNTHTIVRISGSVSEEEGISFINKKLEGAPLTVSAISDNEPLLIFSGKVDNIQISHEGKEYMAVLQGISATVQLDSKEKCRSFQFVDMTYKELVREVLKDTPGAEVIFYIEDKKIGCPIYQYQETDWDFLKRIASQLGTSILPAAISQKPELYFGLPKGKRQEENLQIETVWFDQSYYKFLSGSYPVKKGQFVCRDIISYEKWKIGDRLILEDGTEAAIVAMQGKLWKGLLTWRYTAAAPDSFGTARYENTRIAGISLPGTVIGTQGENIRVWLDIDGDQPLDQAFYYPWSPETGNILYCMPEVGERVEITFDDERGKARGSRCIRRNGAGNGELQDPSKRYFTTAQDKRMCLLPEGIAFLDLKQEVPLKIELYDASGITIESSREITLLAKDGVWLNGESVFFQAPQEVSIVRRDLANPTVINMCNGFDAIGKYSEVRMKGSGGAEFPILESEETVYDIGTEAQNAVMTSTPCLAGKTETERKITGAKVNAIS